MPSVTYVEAIHQALREEMQRDSRVFLIGEDLGLYGGAFKVTKGLLGEFGPTRVIDTPISEAAIIGAAVGASLRGFRPIAEMQFSDFIANGFNQVVNIAATTYYRWHIPAPIVIRCPSGGGFSGGPFHSRNTESWFTHQPGLKIVCPATPYDAKGLLVSAIRDNNPVLYFEHKNLYRKVKGEIPDEPYTIEIGKARVARPGTDVTVLTYGSAVHWCMDAADQLAEAGRNAEIIDLRSLVPLDTDAILTSVRKTGRCLIVHEDNLTGGFGGELAAFVAHTAFKFLDAPVDRVASPDIPTPFAPALERAMYPTVATVREALDKILQY
jgi:2-oxoisovalerate dehydrogenase E1 component beta subunit